MRSIIRLITAGALSLPLIIGAAGIASAEVEYDQNNATATAHGAVVHEQDSWADGDGGSYHYEEWQYAGPHGAGSFDVLSWTWEGDAGYHHEYAWSDSHGASTGDASAYADDDDYYHYHDNDDEYYED